MIKWIWLYYVRWNKSGVRWYFERDRILIENGHSDIRTFSFTYKSGAHIKTLHNVWLAQTCVLFAYIYIYILVRHHDDEYLVILSMPVPTELERRDTCMEFFVLSRICSQKVSLAPTNQWPKDRGMTLIFTYLVIDCALHTCIKIAVFSLKHRGKYVSFTLDRCSRVGKRKCMRAM